MPDAGPEQGTSLERLAERVGHRFGDPSQLRLALTHRSWCAENDETESNERLEFLGDSVLGLIVTDHLFRSHPGLPEGALAKARASVVSTATLAEVAADLDLGGAVLLGKGEDHSGGRGKRSILADALEALIGAVYVDAGIEAARRVVLALFDERLRSAADGPGDHDYKTLLQELAAREWDGLPSYTLTESGPDHHKRFHAVVRLAGETHGRGEGPSKKAAEQAAAKAAWMKLASADRAGAAEASSGTTTSGRRRADA